MGPADHGLLDAPVLVPQVDLQVVDGLAVALEPEVARLDDAGVDGTHGDLMHLFAAHREVPIACVERAGRTGKIVDAHRLEPRVSLRRHARLLQYLALEEVDLRAVRRHRRVGGAHDRRERREDMPLVVGDHGVEAGGIGWPANTEQRYDPSAVCDGVDDLAPELFYRQIGNGRQWRCLAVAKFEGHLFASQ